MAESKLAGPVKLCRQQLAIMCFVCVCDVCKYKINKYVHTNAMQTSVNGVELLQKKHEDFQMTANAHDEKIKALWEQAN